MCCYYAIRYNYIVKTLLINWWDTFLFLLWAIVNSASMTWGNSCFWYTYYIFVKRSSRPTQSCSYLVPNKHAETYIKYKMLGYASGFLLASCLLITNSFLQICVSPQDLGLPVILWPLSSFTSTWHLAHDSSRCSFSQHSPNLADMPIFSAWLHAACSMDNTALLINQ